MDCLNPGDLVKLDSRKYTTVHVIEQGYGIYLGKIGEVHKIYWFAGCVFNSARFINKTFVSPVKVYHD